jgi:hypothetical protein
MRERRYWRIDGWDSTARIFSISVPIGYMSESTVEDLLRSLVAKAGLSNEEIVMAHFNNRARIRSAVLDVQRSSKSPFSLSCGSNPHFVATVVSQRSPTYAP